MSLVLLNLQSNQKIELDTENPFIIGRGNVVGCSDKRVSRNHGRITCTVDGKIRLAALHCNPCFFTRNGVPPVVQLNKNEEETLKEGDYLGLLPNAFWFKITSNKEKEIKKEPSSPKSANEDKNSNPQVEDQKSEFQSNNNCKKDNSLSSSDLVSSTEPNSTDLSNKIKFGTPEFEKTKRLPLWMYEIDEPNQSNKIPSKRPLSRDEEFEEKKQKLSSEIKVENETENGVADIDQPSTSKLKVKVEITDESLNPATKSLSHSLNTAQSQAEGSRESAKEGYESNVDSEENEAVKRPFCQYEGNCYRKNPQHKIDFCHPGDPDYIPYEERPLCQFGSACYRKNEQHKIECRHPPHGSNSNDLPSHSCCRHSIGEERPPCLSGSSCCKQNRQHRKDLYRPPKCNCCHFWQAVSSVSSLLDWDSDNSTDYYFEDYNNWGGYWKTSSPLPDKRRRKIVKKQNSDYENDDEYDLEDPFINDASSDEYVPSELDSEESGILDSSREDD